MKKLLGLIGVILVFGLPTLAQNRIQLGAGYAFRSFDENDDPTAPTRMNMNGFDVNGTFNVTRWFGVTGDVVGTYENQGLNGDNKLYSFMAGPRVYPLGHHRIEPYVQAEFGGSHYELDVPADPVNMFPAFAFAQRGFAWGAGGGVNIFLGRHFGVKGQAMYEQTRFFNDPNLFPPPTAGHQNNFVFTVGPVIRF